MKLEFWFSIILFFSIIFGIAEIAVFWNTFLMIFGFSIWVVSFIVLVLIVNLGGEGEQDG